MFSRIQFFSFLSTSRIQWTHHSVFGQRSDAALVQGARWNAHTIDSSTSAHHSGGCVLAHYLRMLQPQVGLINHSISPLMSLRLPAQIYFVALYLFHPHSFSIILILTQWYQIWQRPWQRYHSIKFVFITATSQGDIHPQALIQKNSSTNQSVIS